MVDDVGIPDGVHTDKVEFIQRTVLSWFAEHGRDLPWRHTRDPYCILVSEVMLQQIQVARAIPFYLAFIARFPTVQSLAEAPIAEVIRVWGDLGRYRRIGYLHRAARKIVERFGGEVPSMVDDLRSLPGVGPYAARAIACFAFEQDVGFIDTNVRRVLGRLFGGMSDASDRELGALANRLVPSGRGWDWNQGLLDFGALICTAKRPKCEICLVRAVCAAYPVSSDSEPKRLTDSKPFVESNRYYRGRVLAQLRHQGLDEASDGIPLAALGEAVKPSFAEADLPWLYGVVTSLEKDGLAVIAEERSAYDAGDGPGLSEVTVRLP